MSNALALSVVIAATDSPEAVTRTLESLRKSRGAYPTQWIVAASSGPDLRPEPADDYHWIAASRGTSVPRLRRLGLEAATAPIVVFSEDSCVFEDGWCDAWVSAFQRPEVRAATCAIVPAMGNSPVDWAVFFCEYAPFLSLPLLNPLRLAGNSFAVRRSPELLSAAEIHESEVALELADQPETMVSVTATRTHHVRRYRFGEALSDRFRFGVEFGQLRAQHSSALLHRLAVFTAPVIFGVQLSRLARTVWGSRQHVGPFLKSLPITALLLSAWSLGESFGWAVADRVPRDGGKPHETEAPLASPPVD